MDTPILTIIVPCYNEEDVLPVTVKQLTGIIGKMIDDNLVSFRSCLLFVDDGSKDRTWEIIEEENRDNPYVKGLKLARNVGHQNALLAGLMTAKEQSDCVISIDADLQDDISVIPVFVEKYWQGNDIVYGVRDKRETDTAFKRNTALGFYSFMRKLGIELIPNHADFRLMSKRALDELANYKERNIFLRGIIPLVGFPSTQVFYDRKERMAGESKYPLKKMIAFAIEGITSFSIAPIRFVTLVGFLAALISIFAGGYAFLQKLLGHTESGWASLMISIWFIGGLQLIGIGLIGEYIGKIFNEVKGRPKFSIQTNLFSEKNYISQTTDKNVILGQK